MHQHTDHDGARGRHQHKGRSSEKHVDRQAVLDALELRPGQAVLDAGCGSGYMAKLFAAQVAPDGRVVALDPDGETIAALAADPEAAGIETLVGDVTRSTGLPAGTFDLVYLATVLHGFDEDQIVGFVAEANRLLKPGGVLAIVEFEKRQTPYGPPLEIRFSPEELRAAMPLAPVRTIRVGEAFYMQLFRKE